MLKKTSESQNLLAVIHNDLVRASYDMTVNELRLLFTVLSQLPKSGEEYLEKPYYVNKEDFVRLGVEPKNVVREIRGACKLLRKKEFKVDTPLGEMIYPIFNSVLNIKDEVYKELKEKYPNSKYDDAFINELRLHNLLDVLDVVTNSDANIVVRIEIHPKVVPYLVNLKANFTKLYLDEFFTFSSAYSFRIYFMLMQFRNDNTKKWWCKITLKDLRKALMLENKYKANKDLKKWVVDTAVTEINEKSPIKVDYEFEMTGKKYTHLVFKYELKESKSKKSNKIANLRDPNTGDMFTIDGLSDKQLKRITRHKDFIKTYGSLATGEAGRDWDLFTEFMVDKIKKDPHRFSKKVPIREYLNGEKGDYEY